MTTTTPEAVPEADRQLTAADIRQLVERYLERHQPEDWRLEVQPDQIRQDGDWWEVVVHPSRREVYSYEYYGRLAEAEGDLADAEGINVMLVPLLPPAGD